MKGWRVETRTTQKIVVTRNLSHIDTIAYINITLQVIPNGDWSGIDAEALCSCPTSASAREARPQFLDGADG